ncbi:DNA/RNA non-specific endonuclease [Arthrobacter sp. NA-172]|uniref:DNA/RNA non-specific endonuclease n=1 Tax=Arthrobacter sp. NA-172 TaxID=3367524 RepID=UPI0037549335
MNSLQTSVCGRELPSANDCGHIFGSQFGPPGEAINLTAMRSDLNRLGNRQYYDLKRTRATAISERKKVDVRMEINYN